MRISVHPVRFLVYLAAAVLSGMFVVDYVGAALTDKYIADRGITNDYLVAIEQSGTALLDLGKYSTVACFLLVVLTVHPILRALRQRAAAIVAPWFIVSSLSIVALSHPDELIRQFGQSLRLINGLFILPALILLAAKTERDRRQLVLFSVLFFYVGYLYSSLSIIFRLLSDSSVIAAGFRYSAIPGYATSTATTFVAALFLLFIILAVPSYQEIPKIVRRPVEWLTAATAMAMIVLTGSRGPFLTIAACGGMYFFLGRRPTVILFVFLAIGALVLLLIDSEYFSALASYFSSREGTNLSTGRTDIWAFGLNSFLTVQDILSGTDASYAAHNSIIGSLMRYGLVVTLIYLVMQFFLFKQSVSFLKLSRGTEWEVLSLRVLSVQVAIFCYGLFENFFFLNFGAIMFLYYLSFGAQIMFYRSFRRSPATQAWPQRDSRYRITLNP